jgi:hypothetical protein
MVGQVAAELPPTIDGYREFVTLFRFRTHGVSGFESQYPYLAGAPIAFRLLKFRVDESLIEEDVNCCNEDLAGLQCIVVATEEQAVEILRIWQVNPNDLRLPKETEVPV